MHGDEPIVQQSEALQVVDGAARRRNPVRRPDADPLEQVSPRAGAVAQKTHFLRRFAEVHAEWTAAGGRGNRAKEIRRDRVRRVRRDRGAQAAVRRQRRKALTGAGHQRVGIRRAEAQQLEEDRRRQHRSPPAAPHASSVLVTSPTSAVPDARASAIAATTAPPGSPHLTRTCAPELELADLALANQPRRPGRHRVARRHASAHPRQLEMRVRVDEAGKDRRFGVRSLGSGFRFAARGSHVRGLARASPTADNTAAVDLDPSVADWRRLDRQNPCGAMDPGHLSARSGGLSSRLRCARGS